MENKKTGIVYHPDFLLHTENHHPECKERLEAIMEMLAKEEVLPRVQEMEPSGKASPDIISLVHDRDYIQQVEEACNSRMGRLDMDTYITSRSYDVARLAVQGGLDAVEEVQSGKLSNAFAFLRPPGHHAEVNRGMGFCLFNNIAIAARYLQEKYAMERIMIVDYDVHHGNGTQHAFEDDPGVLFFSVHQSPAYPGTGSMMETGKGKGDGFTVNAPLPPGNGDNDYAKLFEEVLIPIADAYKPEFLLVSAGHDAYAKDPLASMQVSLEGYASIASYLMDVASKHTAGKTVFFLEGGYNLQGQAAAVYNILNVMGDLNMPLLKENKGSQGDKVTATSRISEIMEVQKAYWPI